MATYSSVCVCVCVCVYVCIYMYYICVCYIIYITEYLKGIYMCVCIYIHTFMNPMVRKISWRRKMAAHSSILAWKIPWTKEPGGLQFMRLQTNWT